MNAEERLQLNAMIQQNNTVDNTEQIRKYRHSAGLIADTHRLVDLMAENFDDPQKVHNCAVSECPTLYNFYPKIFHQLRKSEIKLEMWLECLYELKAIEDNKTDQHEAAFDIGKKLLDVFYNATVTRGEKIDAAQPKPELRKPLDIHWSDFAKTLKQPKSREIVAENQQ